MHVQANVGVQPVEGADWTLMAAKGDQGDAGATGAQVQQVLLEQPELREPQEQQVRHGSILGLQEPRVLLAQPVRRVIRVFKV